MLAVLPLQRAGAGTKRMAISRVLWHLVNACIEGTIMTAPDLRRCAFSASTHQAATEGTARGHSIKALGMQADLRMGGQALCGKHKAYQPVCICRIAGAEQHAGWG